MRSLPLLIFFCLAAGLAPWFWPCSGHAEIVDRIVAEVNNDIITLSELEQMAKMIQPQSGSNPKSKETQAIKRQMLEALIDRKLAMAEAKKRGLTLSDKELNQAMEDFKKNNHIPDDAALARALAQKGMTLEELRKQISDQIIQERLVMLAVGAKKIEIPEAEVRRFYDNNFQHKTGKQVHLQVINIPFPPGATGEQKEEVQKKAESALKDFRLGMPLAQVLQKYSFTSQDLGYINQADLNPQLSSILEKLRPGELAPVQNPEGFQLIVLAGKRSGQPPPFEEVAPQIRRMLTSQIREKQFIEWVKTLREKAHIKIML
jgi:peptidyl-prolyl cis-trans isomerase SurA